MFTQMSLDVTLYVHCAVLLFYISTPCFCNYRLYFIYIMHCLEDRFDFPYFHYKNGVGAHPASASLGTRVFFSES